MSISLSVTQSPIDRTPDHPFPPSVRDMFRDFSVLSMLSTIQAVKLQSAASAANSTPTPPPPHAAPPPADPPSPPPDASNGGGAASAPSDMSRRKQKNPKPFFTSSAEQEQGDKEDGDLTVAEDEEDAENR